MFTGLIEAVCTVRSVAPAPGAQGTRLGIHLGDLAQDAKIGDSIAINGICLTITTLSGDEATFDISPESLKRSSLKSLRSGNKVNAERALRLGDRLGGHFVQGHVDGRGRVHSIDRQGEFWTFGFKLEDALLNQLVPKGSVAIDGISLTVAEMERDGFRVAVIPETVRQTTLKEKHVGDPVNIETDMLVKAVRRTCETLFDHNPKLTVDKLRSMGF